MPAKRPTAVQVTQKTSTALQIVLSIGMLTAVCVGASFAAFLINLADADEQLIVQRVDNRPQPVVFNDNGTVADTMIAIKYAPDTTSEQSDTVTIALQSPIEVVFEPTTGRVISLDSVSDSSDITSNSVQREVRYVDIIKEEAVVDTVVSTSATAGTNQTTNVAVPNPIEQWRVYQFDQSTDVEKLARSVQGLPFVEEVQTLGVVNLHVTEALEELDTSLEDLQGTTEVTPDDYYFNTDFANPPIHSWGQDFSDQWALKNSEFPNAWNVATGDQIVVAVIDSGVDATHPELDGQMWINTDEIADNNIDDDANGYVDDVQGWDFNASSNPDLVEDNDPSDDVGHGTFVSGIIAAKTNNQIGMAGICWQCRIMPVKAFNNGGAYDIHTARAIVYAVDNGADVINMSFGSEGRRPLMQDAIQYAHEHGVVLIASAGNSKMDLTNISPASMNEVMSVGAIDATGALAWFSNSGASLDMVAPGVEVLSLRATGTDMYHDGTHIVDGAYYHANGTSFSAPHVSGLAALVLSQYPDASPETVRAYLRAGSTDMVQATIDCGSYSMNECNQHLGCMYNSTAEHCAFSNCRSITDSNACSGAPICEKNFFLEACLYSLQIADWYDVQLPYAVGRDEFTGFGSLNAAASLTSEPPLIGTLLEPIRATHLKSDADLTLIGTVGGDQFSGYTLEVKPRDRVDNWVTIAESTTTTAIERGTLGTWHTPTTGEWYLVRLTVFGPAGTTMSTTEPYKVETRELVDDVEVFADELSYIDHGSVIGWGDSLMGIAFGDGPDEVKFVRSTDGGQTFESPVLVGRGNLSGWNDRFPTMAKFYGGTVYVSWSEFVQVDGEYHHRIYLSRSTDNGASFGTPTLAVDHIYGHDSIWEQPSLAIDEQGKVFITSIDARAYYDPEIQPQAPSLYYVSSIDGGATFGAETTVTTDFDISANKSISTVARGGVLHIAFARGIQENGAYAKRIYYTASNRLTQEPIVMPRGNAEGYYAFGPNITISSQGTIAVAWTEQWEYHATDAFVAVSTDGTSFGTPVALAQSDGFGSFPYYPYMTFAPAGTLYAAWVEYTEHDWGWPLLQSTVQLSRSFDRGQTFSTPELLSDVTVEKSETVSLAAVGTKLYAAWAQYDSENLFHIYADTTTVCGESCSAAQPYCNTTNGQCEAKCADGTPFGTCARVSQYCNNSGGLVSSCFLCGCPTGQTCKKMAGYPGGKCTKGINPPPELILD